MVSPKVSRPAPRAVAPRHRGHSLAPDHLGEAGGAAMMVLAIGGLSIFIAAIGMAISGLALPSHYSGAIPPPNIGALGTAQVVGGIALMALGTLILASAGALLANLARSRALATAVSALAALLAAAGIVLLLGVTNKDLALIVALGLTAIAFGGAAVVLGRLRR